MKFKVSRHGKGKGVALTAGIPQTKLASAGWALLGRHAGGGELPPPSKLVLVDARTGKVAWTKKLAWWPLVNGKPAAFYRHSNKAAYRVTSAARRPPTSRVTA